MMATSELKERKPVPASRADHLKPYRWKKGQGGNPKGIQAHSRTRLTEEFTRSLCKAWMTYGESALMTAALTAPIEFIRVVASLMPRDVEVTIAHVKAERMSDDQLMEIAMRGKQIEGKATEIEPVETVTTLPGALASRSARYKAKAGRGKGGR
jgi:hypothetical protein